MNLIEIVCPNCNRTLQVNDTLKIISCNYCGFQFQNEQDHNKDHNEKIYEGLELAEALSKLTDPLIKRSQLENENYELNQQLEKSQTDIGADRILCAIPLSIAGFLLIGLLFHIVTEGFYYDDPESWGSVLAIFLANVPLALLFYRFRITYLEDKRKIEHNPAQIENNKNEILRINRMLHSLGYESIPNGYNDVDAIQFFCNALFCKQVDNLPEAIKLYDFSRNMNNNIMSNNPGFENTNQKQDSSGCPKCGCTNVSIINEYTTEGSDYSVGSGICGTICFGPIGVLCGLTGGRKQINTHYYICNDCGYKWRV